MVVVHGFVKEDPHQAQVTLPNLINQVGVKSQVKFLNRIDEVYDSLIEYSGSGYTGSPVVGNRNSGEMETGIPVLETAC